MNKDPDIFLEEDPLVILDIRSAVCMDNIGNNTKHTRQNYRRLHFVKNDKTWKMHKIEWCEVGLQLADIVTKYVDENDLNPRSKFIMVRLDNLDRNLVQEGWQDTG